MSDEFVDKVEEDLRKAEEALEEIGARICSVKGGADCWFAINKSLAELRNAIRSAHKMRDENL